MTYSEKLKDPRWQKKRLSILNRDNWICQWCGNGDETLHVHHYCYAETPCGVSDDMLVTLCASCHKQEEEDLAIEKANLINELRQSKFTSVSFRELAKVFKNTDRGWDLHEPSFDVLKMIIDDDKLWESMYRLFFRRLSKRSK